MLSDSQHLAMSFKPQLVRNEDMCTSRASIVFETWLSIRTKFVDPGSLKMKQRIQTTSVWRYDHYHSITYIYQSLCIYQSYINQIVRLDLYKPYTVKVSIGQGAYRQRSSPHSDRLLPGNGKPQM